MMKVIKPYIKTARDNEEYLLLGSKSNVYFLTDTECGEIQKEMDNLWRAVIDYESKSKDMILDIVVRKDSLLGKYLLSSSKVENLDDVFYYEDVIDALNIAIFENNPIFKQIIPLFQNQIEGCKDKLSRIYGSEVIEYISKNNDFDVYLKQVNNKYKPNQYLVYENGVLNKKEIIDNSKIKIKI